MCSQDWKSKQQVVIDAAYDRSFWIIGDRNTGKTTRLFDLFCTYHQLGYRIVVIDSATEHIEKSLAMRVSKLYPCSYNNSPSINQIHTDSEIVNLCSKSSATLMTWFPSEVFGCDRATQVYIFDVSYYLEEGYRTCNPETEKFLRQIYKRLVAQVLASVLAISKQDQSATIILMDEIELSDAAAQAISTFKGSKTTIVGAVHNLLFLGIAADFFSTIYLDKVYKTKERED